MKPDFDTIFRETGVRLISDGRGFTLDGEEGVAALQRITDALLALDAALEAAPPAIRGRIQIEVTTYTAEEDR